MKTLPDQGTLKALLDYDPLTGVLVWRAREGEANWNARHAGKEAFTANHGNGYRHGRIGGQNYMAHRLIWKWATGAEPEVIDHINGDKQDNRLSNLRSVPIALNARNMPRLRNNTSGHTGVYRCSTTGRWRAEMIVNGKAIKLGRFARLMDAVSARRTAEREFGFHENHGRLASTTPSL